MSTFTIGILLAVIFISSVLIMLYFYVFVFAKLAKYKPTILDQLPSSGEQVTIIVCAFNEEDNLRKNLPLLLNQQYHKNNKPQFEVLVVNHNSEDGTFYLLNEMQKEYPHLNVVHLTQNAKGIPGKKFPLSMGIKSAQFEHLLLTDADCSPASDQWLRLMASQFNNDKKIVLGFSPYAKDQSFINKMIRLETAHTAIQYLSFALTGMPYMGVGRNLAYVRTLFNKNKGFSSHNHIPSGDDDLFINQVADKHNTAIMIHPDAFTYSDPKKSKEEWIIQKKRHLSTGKYYKAKHKLTLGLYAFSHFNIYLFFIPLLFFKAWIVPAITLFILRYIMYFITFSSCMRTLQQHDLISSLFLYDLQYLLYNLKNIPAIFFKTYTRWK